MLDGFAKDDIMLWIIERLQAITPFEISMNTISKLLKEKIAYIEVDTFKEMKRWSKWF
ncbi:hypothetical protein [Clostridium sp.]|uniref:hypothetical protein n=1 Tax=Clostridium sp. TaxID=1506 RepID=UPI0039F58EE2